MTRLLVTGGSGLLGSTVARQGAERYNTVTTTYLTRSVDYAGVDCRRVDLTDEAAVAALAKFAPDYVVHCAAMTDVDQCERKPETAERYNVGMAENVAKLAAETDARMIHLSTDAVFDGEEGNYTVENEPDPVNVYGRTKLDAESIVQQVHEEVVIVRTNFYGWNMTSGQSLAEWVLSKLRAGETVPAFEDAYFTPIYTEDLTTYLFELLEKEFNGTLHIPGRERCNKLDFARVIADVFDLDSSLVNPSLISDVDFEAPRGRDLSLSPERTEQLLETAVPTLKRGLEEMRRNENE
ncbi:dTDP-4-dehydrorhamnose reductase [Halobacteriales archaeon QS_1_69_70]|nr:MAG: dTDP-4-dehydrorhamnose reductase [Halobacteriales archaeon QS_1_69_70]